VTQSYRWIRDHRRLLALPMALLIATEFLQESLSARLLPDAWEKILSAVVLALVDGAFCVGLHRTIILDDVRPGFAFLRWGFELWRYLKTGLIATLGVILIGAAVLLPLGAVMGGVDFKPEKLILVVGITALPILYLAARLFLALPAAALGRDKVFALAWRASKGNALRIFAILILTVFIPAVISGLLEVPASWSKNETLAAVCSLLSSALDVLGTALSTAALSFSYRMLMTQRATHTSIAPQ
jgi:hypothetical protein